MVIALGAAAAPAYAAVSATYGDVVFSDGFESGSLSAWTQALGSGSASVSPAAARQGAYGVRLTNALAQYELVGKTLSSDLVDSASRLWLRTAATSGVVTVAMARDSRSSARMWELLYDASARAFYFYPYRSTGSVEVYTGAGSAPPANTWMQIEVRYNAAAGGGAQLWIDGQTQASWAVSGDYTRTTNYRILQLWNDAATTVDFDDVTVARPSAGPTAPGAPSAVTGTAGDGSVALTWTPPASTGGSPITGYRITPYVGGAPQAATVTPSPATSATVSGLTNGTAYTFTVAAINAIGTGPASPPSPAYTPRAAPTAPGAPGAPTGTAGDRSAALTWTAPADDGGRAIASYRITPYVGSTALAAIDTGSADTGYTVTGLTNGTGYTFRVAATNSVGTGPASPASGTVTPGAAGAADVVFSDGFESGSLSAWTRSLGTGSRSVSAAAAHQGGYGLRMTNSAGQYALVTKSLPSDLRDSSTRLWFRTAATSGLMTVAMARDSASSARMWELLYDAQARGFYFYAYRSTGSVEISTGAGTAPAANTWMDIQMRYTAAAGGGAQIWLNGQTRSSWAVSGDYTRTTNYRILQLWNDATTTADFDDVSVTRGPSAATVPGAPGGVSGTAGDRSVALSWTAPSSNGGDAITSYRITPYVGSTALNAIDTGSSGTQQTVTGLTNGTAYTFRVAATNGAGTGPASPASSPVTPLAPQVPGAPGRPTGVPGDRSVSLSWTAPSDNGGSPITGYRITPFAGSVPLTAILTGSSAASYTVRNLTNGQPYTFTVAAINAAGTGSPSQASVEITPVAARVVVSLEFDDGIATQYQVRQMLRDRGMHGTFFVNSGWTTDELGGWRMTWSQLGDLFADGNEIGGHGLTHATLTTMTSPVDQRREVCDDRTNLIDHGFAPVTSFAYPYGAYEENDAQAAVADCGYSSGRTVGGIRSTLCPQCPFAEAIPPANPFVTRTPPDVRNDTTLQTLEQYVTQAEQNGGGWVQLVFHHVCAADCDIYSTTPTLMQAFLDWLQARAAAGAIVVRTVGDVMASR